MILAIIVLLVAWFLRDSEAPLGEQSQAKVTRIADGDTLEVVLAGKNDKQRVRMLAIDAPELKMSGGQASKKALTELLKACKNMVEIQEAYKDQYGRIVGKILCNGKDLNLEQVRAGHAWVYERHIKDAFPGDESKYLKAQKQAKEDRLGLWEEKSPQAPWEWRKANPR